MQQPLPIRPRNLIQRGKCRPSFQRWQSMEAPVFLGPRHQCKGNQRAVMKQRRPPLRNLLRSSRLGPQTLSHMAKESPACKPALGVPGNRVRARCADIRRIWWRTASCTSARGVDPCITVAGCARRRTGPRTRPYAEASKPRNSSFCLLLGLWRGSWQCFQTDREAV
jgi:hypothetical protein